jgi:2,4-dienoyl-CoA reductase-like NADH-dependent reductase (Old Yellow Enzyme family)
VHLGARAQGGSGLIMTESAAVAPEGLTTPQDTDMWNDEQQAVWTRIVEFGHSQGAAMAIHSWPTPDAMPDESRLSPASQKATSSPLTRAGRRWDRQLSPTPVRPVPHALTIEEIGGVVQAFATLPGALIVPVRRR